jgi:nitrite reductase/ring-hydroxylating ferredoxin subunit
MTLKFAANLNDLNPDEPFAATIDNEQIALYLVDGEVYATHNVCTHQFALLSDGFLEDGCIECPLHQGKFNVKTGTALCAPATTPIRTYKVQLDNGAVMVEL